MDVLGAEVGARVPLVAVAVDAPVVGVEVMDDVAPPCRVGDGTTLPVRVRVAVCTGKPLAEGEGLDAGSVAVAVTPRVAVAGS
jgi:hypothetical protein